MVKNTNNFEVNQSQSALLSNNSLLDFFQLLKLLVQILQNTTEMLLLILKERYFKGNVSLGFKKAGYDLFTRFWQPCSQIIVYINNSLTFMNRKFDWNDSIQNFVKTKVQRPEVLADLLRRERQCRQKRNYEKKIEQRRELYQSYSFTFRTQQQQFQLKTSDKRQMQKEIAKLAIQISKLLKQLVKQESQTQMSTNKLESQQSEQSQSINKKKKAGKQISDESLIGEYALIKQNLNRQIKDLLDQRGKLDQQLLNIKSKEQTLKTELNKHVQIQIAEEQLIKIEQQLQKQRQLKTKFRFRLESIQEAKKREKKLKSQKQVALQKCLKRVKDFAKQSKKVMENAQDRMHKKYNQFLKKYRPHSEEKQKFLQAEFQGLKRNKKNSILLYSIDSEIFKYQEPLEHLSKYINRKFTPEEFQQLFAKCEHIQLEISQRQNLDTELKEQITNLKANLQRKTKALQLEYQKFAKSK